MRATDVKPKDWYWDESYTPRILFESNEENYSVIWGKYKNIKALGVRWNGGTERGYPGQGGHPTWYVEPDFIAISIIQRLLNLALENQNNDYLGNIRFALTELIDKMSEE